MSFLDSIAKIAKSVVKSPITKVVAGGVSLVMPAVGIPALAGLAAADKVVSAADKGRAVLKQVKAGSAAPGVPGGRSALGATLKQANFKTSRLVQGTAASKIVAATKQAAKTDPNAKRALAALQLVQAAKQGQPAARAALASTVRKQVQGIVAAGQAKGASPQQQQAARLTVALVKATAARKRVSRKFGVDRRTARVVRVA